MSLIGGKIFLIIYSFSGSNKYFSFPELLKRVISYPYVSPSIINKVFFPDEFSFFIFTYSIFLERFTEVNPQNVFVISFL